MTVQTSKRPLKYERIADRLRERILGGQYPAGSKLPSIVELSQQFEVSIVTAFKGVRKLADERLVVCHSNARGTVVSQRGAAPLTTRATTLACLLRPMQPRNDMDNFGLDVTAGMRNAISARGYRFIYHGFDEVDYEKRMVELAKEPWVAGVLVDGYTPLPTLKRLSEMKIPVAIFNRHEHLNNVTCVAPDYERVGRESVRILHEKGYRRLAFYGVMPDATGTLPIGSWPTEALLRGFHAGVRNLAPAPAPGDVFRLPGLSARGVPKPEPEELGLPRVRPAGWAPLGVFATSDVRANQLLYAIGRTNLVLGRDIGVIGCFDLECGRSSQTPPSTWTCDRQALGADTVAELLARIENPELSRAIVKTTMDFVDRGTA